MKPTKSTSNLKQSGLNLKQSHVNLKQSCVDLKQLYINLKQSLSKFKTIIWQFKTIFPEIYCFKFQERGAPLVLKPIFRKVSHLTPHLVPNMGPNRLSGSGWLTGISRVWKVGVTFVFMKVEMKLLFLPG